MKTASSKNARNAIMLLKIRKLREDAVLPHYAKDGDAGMDLTAVSIEVTEAYVEYGTGLALEILH